MSLERIVDKPIEDTTQQVYSSSFTAKNDIAENMAHIFDRGHAFRKFVSNVISKNVKGIIKYT